MRALLFLGCIVVAGSAQAQTTTCGPEFGKWVCRTQQPPPNIYGQGMAAFDAQTQRLQEQRAQREATAAAHHQAELDLEEQHRRAGEQASALNAQHVREMVGDQVAQGHCAYAKTLALQAGELDLAEQVVRLCKPN